MFAQSRLSSLQIDVPKPLEMFERDKIHPDNVALEKSAHDPRLMPRQQLRRFQRTFKAAELALSKAGMLDYPDVLLSLRDRYRQAKVDYLEADPERRPELLAAVREAKQFYKNALSALDGSITWRPSFFERLRSVPATAWRMTKRHNLRDILRIYSSTRERLAEHASAVEYKSIRHKLRSDMDKEARLFEAIIIERWTQMGHCYSRTVTRNGKSRTITDRVKFQEIVVSEDAIHFKILATTIGLFRRPIQHMPTGVSVTKLLAPDMLIDLTHACEREVTTPHGDLDKINHVNGGWLTVSRLSKADGLLKHVPLGEVWAEYPRDMSHLIPIPVGVKRGQIIHYMPLVSKPHVLIAGQTGSGKSNLYNVLICTLIKYHPPSQVQLILCDLKEGISFNKYDNVQHLAHPVVTELDELLIVLKRLEKLRHERTLTMKGLADDINEYNRRVAEHRRMPHIIVIMDEFQQVAAKREIRGEIINYVEQLTAKARSAGIHMIPGTQTPMSDQVPGMIKNNMAVVISGRMRTLAASVAAFGNKEALDLANIPGRMNFEDGANRFQIQVPYCSDSNIKEAMLSAAAWRPSVMHLPELDGKDTPPVFDEAALLSYVVNHAAGRLSTRALYPYASEYGMSRSKLATMVDETIATIKANGGTVEHDGSAYTLERSGKGYLLRSTDDDGVSYALGEAAH
jgi:energy-coupling factor transporter ATP-binding protein EcfA2